MGFVSFTFPFSSIDSHLEIILEWTFIALQSKARSISDAFIIIDEAQNLTSHELKTIVTRVGENTKIVLTGDIEQIDNVYVDATSNGLTHAVEKLKKFALTGHVTLVKGERSEVATIAAKYL